MSSQEEPMPVWMFWLETRDTTIAWCEALLQPESTWYVLERRWFARDGKGHSEVMVRIGRELFPATLPIEKAVSAARFELGLSGLRVMTEGPCLPSSES